MAYVGYAGQGNPATGQQGAVRSQVDPGYVSPGGGERMYSDPTGNLQGLFSMYKSAVLDPSQMLGQAQINQLQNQMGLTGLQSDLASQLQQQQAGWGLQGIGLQREGLGVQQGTLSRQMELLPQQYGLQQQGFDIQGQQLGLGKAEIMTNAAKQRRQLEHQLVSSGMAAPEANAQRGDILQQRAFGLFGNQLQQNQLGVTRQQAALNFKEQQAQQQDAQKMLGIHSKQLNLSEDEIKGRLQNALNQIGISNQVSVDQLLSEMYKVQQGEISPLQGLFGDLYSIGGITVPSGG